MRPPKMTVTVADLDPAARQRYWDARFASRQRILDWMGIAIIALSTVNVILLLGH